MTEPSTRAGAFGPFRRHDRAVLVALAATVALLAVGWGAQRLWLEDLVRAAYEGRSIELLNRRFGQRHGAPFALVLADAREELASAVAMGLALGGLLLALFVALHRPRRVGRALAALALWWLSVELLAAPFLARAFGLTAYLLIRDVDHRPRAIDAEWNVDALRATPDPAAFGASSLSLVVLGDSYAFGFGVRGSEAFPSVLRGILRERHPEVDVEVANFAWPSSCPLLSWRRLVDIGGRYSPDLVLMCVDMTDFQDEIRYRNMLARRGLYRLYDVFPITIEVAMHALPGAFERVLSWSVGGQPLRRFFATEAPLGDTRRWFAPLVESLGRIDAWCRERGVDFATVVLPRGYQYSARESPRNWEADQYAVLGPWSAEPFRFFDELAREVDWPVLTLLEPFRQSGVFPTCFDDDPHWNAVGHRIAAEAIAEAIEPMVRARLAAER